MKTLIRYALSLLTFIPVIALAAPVVSERQDTPARRMVSISTPAGQDRVRIVVTQVSYPGVPERSACRMLFKAVNESRDRVDLSAQLHTFDTGRSDLNSWLVPTGVMAPGQAVERIYSCKTASFIALDQRSDYGWPRICTVNGERQSPCPVALKVDFNLPQLGAD